MRVLTAVLIIVYTFQHSAAASADGEPCATSASCSSNSTCYRGLCTRGLNGLPCNSTSDCFGTASCEKSEDLDPICFRGDRCDTSEQCLLHETCLTAINLCSAGTQNMPCSSFEECLPSYECRNSRCNELPRAEPIANNPLNCIVSNQTSIPELKIIELPSWLIGALGLAVAIVAAQAPHWTMKPEDERKRRTVFYVFLCAITLIWIAYFVCAVIDQVMQQRIISHGDEVTKITAECFPADSAIFREFHTETGELLKLFRVVTIGFFVNVVASVVFSLAVMWLIWDYLDKHANQKLIVEWKKVIPVGLFVVAIGLTAIFVGGNIANDKATFSNPYCEIVEANEQQYVSCGLSEENNSGLEVLSFRNETVNGCSEMAKKNIEEGNVSEGSIAKIFAAGGQFTDSEVILSEILRYQVISLTLGAFYFGLSNVGSKGGVLKSWLAFVFLKAIFQLMLSMLIVKLVYKSHRRSGFIAGVAILLVMSEIGVKITGFVFKASIRLQIMSIDVVSACGFTFPGSGSNGVLDRSFSPGAGDVLKAGMVFLFAVIGFKELFTSREQEVIRDVVETS